MIVKTSTGVNRRIGSVNGLAALLDSQGIGRRGGPGSGVSEERLFGLPAANLAIRIASEAIGELEVGVYRGKDLERRQVRSTWQSRFFDGLPNGYQSWSSLLAGTEAAVTARNAAFWRLDVDAGGRPVFAHQLHNDAVSARWSTTTDQPEYRYRLAAGGWSDWTSTRVVQFRVGHVEPECIIPPTPVQLARTILSSMLAKPKHADDTFNRAGSRQLALTYPTEVTAEQAEAQRKALEPLMTGSGNAGSVRVFGGGATITTVGLSFEDMQFVELMQLDAELTAQIFAVPASLLGVMKNDRPLSPEHEETRFDRYYLGPRRTRIEGAIQANALFFGVGARDYPKMVPRPIRGDVKTQAAAVVSLVQAGVYVPDEGRAELGKEPLPDGVGQIVQVTPVGGAPNPGTVEVVVDEDGDPIE